jgi:hypothetical protein
MKVTKRTKLKVKFIQTLRVLRASFEKSSGMGHYGLRKISHGVYPERAERFEMIGACSLLSFRADARNFPQGFFIIRGGA